MTVTNPLAVIAARETAASRTRARMQHTLILAIVALLFFLPFAIVALVRYRQARGAAGMYRMPESRARMEQSRRWSIYAVSTGLALTILALSAAALTANDFAVYRTFFDLPVIAQNFGYLLGGFWLNVSLFLVAEVVILIWSTIVAAVRELPGDQWRPLRAMAVIYSDVFRGVPVLLVLLIVGLGLNRTGLPLLSSLTDFQAALIALTLSYGAYMSEVIRAGLHSVHWSQAAAARSIGLSYFAAFRLVVLPQAVRTVVPPLLNGFISLQKDTALVSVLGLLDGVNRAQAVSSYSASLAPYAGIAICYIVITIPLTRFTDYLEAKNRKKRLAAG